MRLDFEQEIAKYQFALPIMPLLAEHLKAQDSFSNQTIGWHCHLTEITAVAADVILQCGAQLHLSECSPDTTDGAAVEYMRTRGATVHLGERSCAQLLQAKPVVISDTGLVLISAYLRQKERFVFGASEITTSGIRQISDLPDVPLPVIDINGGSLKKHIENYHGVGDGVIDLLAQLTGRLWRGHTAAVIGYGNVGSGVARYLRESGLQVSVVDTDPVRALIAHYDGYNVSSLAEVLPRCNLIVTATGHADLIAGEQWSAAMDGALFLNVGHWSTEFNLEHLRQFANDEVDLMPFLKEFTLSDGRRIYVLCEGSPANVVALAGSPEPTLIHLTTEILCMQHLLDARKRAAQLATGLQTLPREVERQAAQLALRALNLSN